jgi:hypothetical protein
MKSELAQWNGLRALKHMGRSNSFGAFVSFIYLFLSFVSHKNSTSGKVTQKVLMMNRRPTTEVGLISWKEGFDAF